MMNDSGVAPLLSVQTLVYNHAPFLRDALEGFVMQQTNFPFEVVVHDDASTDGSADIIREYAARYPHIIKPVCQTENLYSKRDGSLGRAVREALSPHSRYIAYCEGDDYWTDPHKLQKQVDFLEAHPDYTMCCHNALMKCEDASSPDSPFSVLEDRDYSGEEIFRDWIVPTASVVIRRDVLRSELYAKALSCTKLIYGDIRAFLTAAAHGRVRAMSDTMCVYRRHPGGAVFAVGLAGKLRHFVHVDHIPRIFGRRYRKHARAIIFSGCCGGMIYSCTRRRYRDALTYFLNSCRYAPLQTLWHIVKMPWILIRERCTKAARFSRRSSPPTQD